MFVCKSLWFSHLFFLFRECTHVPQCDTHTKCCKNCPMPTIKVALCWAVVKIVLQTQVLGRLMVNGGGVDVVTFL